MTNIRGREKPSITTHPQGDTVREGENVTLSCNATGNPVPTISWTRDASPVDTRNNISRISISDDKKQLTITNVKRTDSGKYQCVAENRVGSDTSDAATLDVQYPPEITVHPNSEPKTEGGNLTLSCDAVGNPVPTISWTKDGSPVDTSGRISFSEDKKQLTITNMNRTDSGVYLCMANNNLGNETSNVTTLDVQFCCCLSTDPPEFTAYSQNVTKPEGDNVTLSCNATGNPAPAISWFINGSPIDTTINNSRISFSGNQKHLTITNLSRTDSGKYRCKANNSLGNGTYVARLDVLSPLVRPPLASSALAYRPEGRCVVSFDRAHCCFSSASATPAFTEEPRDQSPEEGNNITLEWRYNFRGGSFRQLIFGNRDISLIVEKTASDQRPFIAPAFSGRLLANITETYTSITFLGVNRTDSETYTLTLVGSSRESTDSKVEILVNYPPKIAVHPGTETKIEGGNVELSCDAVGKPDPTLSWTRNGSPIRTSDDSSISISSNNKQLTITNVKRTDSGEYRCVASNSLANTSSNAALLDVQYQPEFTAHSQNVTKPEGDNVTLSCNATGNPAPAISWFINGSPMDTTINNSRISISKNQNHLTISNLSRTDSGKYRCKANNKLGNATSDVTTLDVQYKPEITIHPKKETKLEGDNVTFSCKVDGNPVPTISWTTDGSPLDTNDNFTRISLSLDKKQLTITNVSRTDSGEYRCVASNILGNETSSAALLDVQYHPKITVHPVRDTKTEGDNLTLSCNVTGNPVPTISWTRDRSLIDTNVNSRISFSADKKQLTIMNVNRRDSGEYRCVARNSLGNDTSNVSSVDIQDKPEITAHPQGAEKTEGDNVTLSCNATANPIATISWTRDGSPINTTINSRISFSEDKKKFTIINVNRTDSGEYRCVASNELGNHTSDAANLDIQYAPTITAHLQNYTKTEGSTVIFSCNAIGNPVPTISWTRNGSPVNKTINSRISFLEDKKQLKITDVNRTDSGEYRCVARNSFGNDTSNVATLDVQYKPEITAHPLTETKTEGDNVTFSCDAVGNPVPTISWTRNGSPVDTSDNFSRIGFSVDKKELTITSVSRTDSGEYRCVAENSVGNETSNAVKLDVQHHPEITARPQVKTTTEGDNVTLSCNTTGNPVPTISWTINGTPVDRRDNPRISFSERKQQLIITNVSRTDSGEYRCAASNSLGNDTSNTTSLDVQCKWRMLF
ncbi:hemicentin-2-like [Orbicella faveolata]|uniref:hemicentin-2-like n=1 Tax=Orbicella faveolata TaxID=48498 RepID=UPI0009E55196|nr:hemicentin-2-like [Orbicella faveolata]